MSKQELSEQNVFDLKRLTLNFRKKIVEMIHHANSGHPGSSLSAVDIITTLFLHRMDFDKESYADLEKDVFVLSKGHGVPALYAVLDHLGMLPSGLDLNSLRKLGSPLQGHPDRIQIPEVVASTGSLGQGLSIAVGIALAKRIHKSPYHTFVMTGDGELQEGQIWEAVMFAGKYKIDNMTTIVDRNYGQIDGFTENVMPLEPLDEKFRAFNWDVLTIDGHNFPAIFNAIHTKPKDKPLCIIAENVKGKGVSFMENEIKWHGVAPNAEEYKKAMAELDAAEKDLLS